MLNKITYLLTIACYIIVQFISLNDQLKCWKSELEVSSNLKGRRMQMNLLRTPILLFI